MLNLTLTRDDPIDIGAATIHLLEVQGNQVHIGIKAPKAVKVLRRKAKKRSAGHQSKTLTELLI